MAECKDCIHFCVCSTYTAPNESYSEVGGCPAFKNSAEFVRAVQEPKGVENDRFNTWISVKERLPEVGKKVIVARDEKVEQGVYRGVNGWWKVYGTNTKSVTHWMPMPQPPKGE